MVRDGWLSRGCVVNSQMWCIAYYPPSVASRALPRPPHPAHPRSLPCYGFLTIDSHTVAMARHGTAAELSQQLHRMDGGRYGSYKSLSGSWDFHNFTLEIGRAQADPFAPPTRMSVRVSPRAAAMPDQLADSAVRRHALTDYLVRAAERELRDKHCKLDSGEQEVLERSACRTEDGQVLFRFGFALPGNGRKT